MSTQQLDKIQTLEKRLQAVDAQPEDNNIKKTPAFIHMNAGDKGKSQTLPIH
jgi:hypothetical protein